VSPKPGEYDALARSLGTEPIRLEPGGSVRVNPLTGEGALAIEQLSRLLAIAETVLGRPLTPKERSATRSDLDGARNAYEVTIPRLVAAPRAEWGEGDDVRLALEELCNGELAGMFDGPTTKGIDLDAPIVVLDLGAVWNSTALSAAMVAAPGGCEPSSPPGTSISASWWSTRRGASLVPSLAADGYSSGDFARRALS
jgi:hypothetical protein